MTYQAKLISGIIFITVPTIQYGGYFLLRILSKQDPNLTLTSFQQSMFRAGHAHAGVLVILALVAQIFIDYAALPSFLMWVARVGFPVAAILVSGGFFAGAIGSNVSRPTRLIRILYVGVVVLAASVLILGVGLIRSY
ncbi:MAG: hypothetical protein RIG62_06890 [Cyclobacteriaceae bacterium]